jgi:hypothetical protein
LVRFMGWKGRKQKGLGHVISWSFNERPLKVSECMSVMHIYFLCTSVNSVWIGVDQTKNLLGKVCDPENGMKRETTVLAVNASKQHGSSSHGACLQFVTWHTLLPWRWMQHVCPKRLTHRVTWSRCENFESGIGLPAE